MDAKLLLDILMGVVALVGIVVIINGIYHLVIAQKIKKGIC